MKLNNYYLHHHLNIYGVYYSKDNDALHLEIYDVYDKKANDDDYNDGSDALNN